MARKARRAAARSVVFSIRVIFALAVAALILLWLTACALTEEEQ